METSTENKKYKANVIEGIFTNDII